MSRGISEGKQQVLTPITPVIFLVSFIFAQIDGFSNVNLFKINHFPETPMI
ncbi:hypothetical protein [Paenibacillus sp. WC2504]|uniref:hypothetical protein n=1 Tax=Paenibacillus sp. WC2504 TaxID=3461403 RepID=UPI00404645C3